MVCSTITVLSLNFFEILFLVSLLMRILLNGRCVLKNFLSCYRIAGLPFISDASRQQFSNILYVNRYCDCFEKELLLDCIVLEDDSFLSVIIKSITEYSRFRKIVSFIRNKCFISASMKKSIMDCIQDQSYILFLENLYLRALLFDMNILMNFTHLINDTDLVFLLSCFDCLGDPFFRDRLGIVGTSSHLFNKDEK